MKKTILGIAIIAVVAVIGVLAFKNYSGTEVLEPSNNVMPNNPTKSELTVSAIEVRKNNNPTHEGDVYITTSDGNTKQITQSKGPEDVAEYYDTVSYTKAFISPDHKYVAVEANSFEEQFVEVYEASTDVLHKRTYGVVVRWREDGLLEVKSCDLSGEECNKKISISQSKPWLFKQPDGVSVGNALLTDSTDFITNIKKSNELSIFAKMLEAAGPEAIPGTGPFTVFAPTNEALQAWTGGTAEKLLLPENRAKLITLIRNHVFAGMYNTVEIDDKSSLRSINNTEAHFSSNDWSYIKINNDQGVVVNPNIYSSNGIVHIISGVIH